MANPILIIALAALLALGALDIAVMLQRQKELREESSLLVSWVVFGACAIFCAALYPATRMRTMFHLFFVVGLVVWPAIGLLRQRAQARALATLLPRMGLYLYAGTQIEA
ncbi:MAG: hypothetical protein O2923_08380 [Verrucomicrobia bacterium]|nr:hypothetical protein [Verrucomicrobiota bacterium]MDA1085883.1 hypothetical protein [Verrucomicrobiota bacterium]